MKRFCTRLASTLAAHSAPFSQRTHKCGALSAHDSGSRVVLTGWLLPERKGKAVSFFPLRDSSGTVQLTVGKDEHLAGLVDIPVESSVLIEGTVQLRPESARRPGPAGDIDVKVDKFVLLNPADSQLPFVPSNTRHLPNEQLRLRYRYLDLRRTQLTENLKKRSEVAHIVRQLLHEEDFTEVETPVLLRSSPEGARTFLTPARVKDAQEPQFYALQQSPQQPKQLLICSGAVDKYYQIAKCFRDEDGRKDRQPEFTQIDMEMAYVSWGNTPGSGDWRIGGNEVREVTEALMRRIWSGIAGVELPQFPVMTYNEAMSRYGSDKPDTRFGLEISTITDLIPEEVVEAIVIKAGDSQFFPIARAEVEDDVSWVPVIDSTDAWLSQITNIPASVREGSKYSRQLAVQQGDVVYLSRRPLNPEGGSTALGRQRLRLSEAAVAEGLLTLPDSPHFLWVTEFPLFTRADDDKEFLARGRWSSSHHPFTAPMWEDIPALYDLNRTSSVRGQHYDLVLNGVEIAGGSVRVHDPQMQDHVFKNILKLSETEAEPFEQLIHALRCGAPPHGGIAIGFDRLMAMLCGAASIRDVIAFPKTGAGTDLLFRSPGAIPQDMLDPYGIMPKK